MLPGLERISCQRPAHRGRRHRGNDPAAGGLGRQVRTAPPGQRRAGVSGQFARQRFHLGHYRGSELPWPTRARPIAQTIQALFAEPAPPFAGGVHRDSELARDRRVRCALASSEHDPGAQHVTMLAAGTTSPGSNSRR
jgi:hypothetical protein